MPGIQSVDIKSKSMGSLREANITIRINDPEQLELIETLYLKIGYSIFLEWGNSSYYKYNSTDNYDYIKGAEAESGLLFDFLTPTENLKNCPTNFIKKIEEQREKSQGNYDALFGRVKNFSWEFTTSGYYTATLSIISWGDIIESLSIDGFYPDVVLSKLAEDDETDSSTVDKKDESLLNSFIYEASLPTVAEEITYVIDASSGIRTNITESFFNPVKKTLKGLTTTKIKAISGVSTVKSNTGTETKSIASDYSEALTYNRELTDSFEKAINGVASFGDNVTYSYIRLGDLLDFIKTRLLIYTENCDEPIVTINTETETNFCYNPLINVSADPSKVMINTTLPLSQQGLKRLAINRDRDFNDVDPDTTDNEIKRSIFGVTDIQGKNVKLEEFTSNKVLSEGKQIANVPVGLIMNIYFEKEFLYQQTTQLRNKKTGQLSIYKFLKSLLDEANSCLGGVNKLDLRVVNDTVLEIYDQIPIYGWKKTQSEPQEFNIFGLKPVEGINTNGSFVTNFGLKTELTNEFSTITAIGAQANGSVVGEDATFFSRFNYGLEDRFYPKKLDSSSKNQKTLDLDEEEYQSLLVKILELWSDYSLQGTKLVSTNMIVTTLGANITNGYTFPYFRIKSIPQYVKLQKAFLKTAIKLKAKYSESLSNQIGMLPINLNLEMDGISGIRIYDQIRVNTKFLPSYYPKLLMFIIKGVSHSFNGSRWITSIETIAQPKVQYSKNLKTEETKTSNLPEFIEDDAEVASRGEGLIDVTKTYSGSKKTIIDIYGWPVDIQEISGRYYAKPSSQDAGNRNVYFKSNAYLTNTTNFEYNLKLQGSLVNSIKIKYLLKDLVTPLKTVLGLIEQKGLSSGVRSIDAAIYPRDTTGKQNIGNLSGHSFGVALDVNAYQYPYGNAGYKKYTEDLQKGLSSAKVIEIFANSGLFNWGGDYTSSSKDAHHFSLKTLKGNPLSSI